MTKDNLVQKPKQIKAKTMIAKHGPWPHAGAFCWPFLLCHQPIGFSSVALPILHPVVPDVPWLSMALLSSGKTAPRKKPYCHWFWQYMSIFLIKKFLHFIWILKKVMVILLAPNRTVNGVNTPDIAIIGQTLVTSSWRIQAVARAKWLFGTGMWSKPCHLKACGMGGVVAFPVCQHCVRRTYRGDPMGVGPEWCLHFFCVFFPFMLVPVACIRGNRHPQPGLFLMDSK